MQLQSCPTTDHGADDHREEAGKACEADAAKAWGALRQERLEWEKSDAESRSALHSLREEWRMLQDTNAQLHATVTRLTKALEVSPHAENQTKSVWMAYLLELHCRTF